ncbi:hypothetical protein [uncultured Gammaproteobacteria bacterium]|jgi:hypothetical protein|nr:hypothetical protein [uncultured Gammaproteobacteria bacterium]CAC9558203.1 hypothetical protein [uncultured Gammaproteobacteria bacterium]CAC9562716.1 hypothetical protein [uncultured Gammaproteobacteria bacterium]CAC9566778.1 hypothetical protein [uncultured Gammaproteobacteria bacterium]CAC9573400.1 hypothetical protein [uncultured Gammaproteobacteria bacterium]
MGMGFATFKLMDIDGFSTFALTGRDGFVTHPCELVIVGKGYKPFPTFGCWEGNKIIQQEIEGRLG